jgi:DNA-binding response OmpR family regulator
MVAWGTLVASWPCMDDDHDENAQSPRILIIDDERDHAELTALVLERRGYQVKMASSGEEGLSAAVAFVPDLIVLDVYMPRQDGFHTAAALKAHPRTAAMPVLFLSACADDAARASGIDPSSLDIMQKPFRAAELLAHVERSLGRALRSA